MHSTNYRHLLTWRNSLFTGLLISLLVVILMRQSGGAAQPAPTQDDAGFLSQRPSSTGALVARAALIVIGTVGDIEDEGAESAFGTATPDPGAPPFPSFDFTEYAVRVESVLGGPDAEEVLPGGQIVVRVHGRSKNSEMAGGDMKMPRAGDRRLFVLERSARLPGIYFPHPWGIFRIDGTTAQYDDVSRTSVAGFTRSTAVPAFIDALRTASDGRRLGQ